MCAFGHTRAFPTRTIVVASPTLRASSLYNRDDVGTLPGSQPGSQPGSLKQRTQSLSSDAPRARGRERHKLNSLADFRNVALERLSVSGGQQTDGLLQNSAGKELSRKKNRVESSMTSERLIKEKETPSSSAKRIGTKNLTRNLDHLRP